MKFLTVVLLFAMSVSAQGLEPKGDTSLTALQEVKNGIYTCESSTLSKCNEQQVPQKTVPEVIKSKEDYFKIHPVEKVVFGVLIFTEHWGIERDINSTFAAKRRLEAQGRLFHEINPLARPFVEDGRVKTLKTLSHVSVGIVDYLCYRGLRSKNKFFRAVYWIPPAAMTVIEHTLAANNNKLGRKLN